MDPDVPPVDQALPAVRDLLESAGVPYGYLRTTEDIELLIEAGSQERLHARLEAAIEPVELRRRLLELRRDSLEEASWPEP